MILIGNVLLLLMMHVQYGMSSSSSVDIHLKVGINSNSSKDDMGVSCNLLWNYEGHPPLIMLRQSKTIIPPIKDKDISAYPNRIPLGIKLIFACPGENNQFNYVEGTHTKLHGECLEQDIFKFCLNNYTEITELSKLSCTRKIQPSIIKQDNNTLDNKNCNPIGGELYKVGYIYGDYKEFKDLYNTAVCNDTACRDHGGQCFRSGISCPSDLPYQTSQGEPFCTSFYRCCYSELCEPATCTYKQQAGNCSLESLPGTTGVGSQECKKGCQCYIKENRPQGKNTRVMPRMPPKGQPCITGPGPQIITEFAYRRKYGFGTEYTGVRCVSEGNRPDHCLEYEKEYAEKCFTGPGILKTCGGLCKNDDKFKAFANKHVCDWCERDEDYAYHSTTKRGASNPASENNVFKLTFNKFIRIDMGTDGTAKLERVCRILNPVQSWRCDKNGKERTITITDGAGKKQTTTTKWQCFDLGSCTGIAYTLDRPKAHHLHNEIAELCN